MILNINESTSDKVLSYDQCRKRCFQISKLLTLIRVDEKLEYLFETTYLAVETAPVLN